MSIDNPIGSALMAIAKSHAAANCAFYPALLKFKRPKSAAEPKNVLREEIARLCSKMATVRAEHGHPINANEQDLVIAGWLSIAVDTQPLLGPPALPSATVVVMVRNLEGFGEFFDRLINDHRAELIDACNLVVDINVGDSFDCEESLDLLLRDPLESRLVSADDLVFVTLKEARNFVASCYLIDSLLEEEEEQEDEDEDEDERPRRRRSNAR